jgi:hypothetical protein
MCAYVIDGSGHGSSRKNHLVALWFESVYVNNVDNAADSVSVTSSQETQSTR